MIIAITYKDGMIFPHFGKSKYFIFYEVKDKNILSESVVKTEGQGHIAITDFLALHKTDAVICGVIGEGAYNALKERKISVFSGYSGCCDDSLHEYINGNLVPAEISGCINHGHNCSCNK